jgi:cellulose synthase/poly-beta-1,6-N-acetylglucosamine synthase-like glycosyltransferase
MAIYSISLLIIFFYALAQLNLLINYVRARKNVATDELLDLANPDEVPYVTIQLPLYNELYVTERLLNNIVSLDYPIHKLEIQVLDDSTDESVVSTAAQINALQKTGIDIQHIRREDRVGFKAGALKEGLETAKGELIAIFDADFLPDADWLQKNHSTF